MIKCNICGKEFKTGRSFHGHIIRWHPDEYKKSGNDDKSFMASGSEKEKKKDPAQPPGLRLLRRTDQDENEAYKAGYRYIDDDENVYTHEELKEEGIL